MSTDPIQIKDGNGTIDNVETVDAGNNCLIHGKDFVEYLRDSSGGITTTHDTYDFAKNAEGIPKRAVLVAYFETHRLGTNKHAFGAAPTIQQTRLTIAKSEFNT